MNDSRDTSLMELLDRLEFELRRFVVITSDQAAALALWVVHTHAFEAADCTPYLSISSAEKQSGKTRLLEVLELLVARPWLTGRATAAVLARKVDAEKPTLLLDESDAAFKGPEEYSETLRGILNTGYRSGGRVSVCVGRGTNFTYHDLSTFCAKAIAGIGSLPDTIADRSIPIRLKRRATHEHVERFRRRDVGPELDGLRADIASLVSPLLSRLTVARPELPDELGDRAADVWEPLLAIADAANGKWPELARRAAVALSSAEHIEDVSSAGVRLLADISSVFRQRHDDRLSSAELITALLELEDSPWAEWRHGKPISPHSVARLLRAYGVRPRQVRFGATTAKGYLLAELHDAVARYVPQASDPTETPETTTEPPGDAGTNGTETRAISFGSDNSDHEPRQAGVSDVSLREHPAALGGEGRTPVAANSDRRDMP